MEIKTHVDFDNTATAFASRTNKELRKAYFLFALVNKPFFSKLATNLVKLALRLRIPVEWAVRPTVFDHFCGGETIADSQQTIEELSASNLKTILDYSVEGEKSEEGFETAMQETLKTMEKAAGGEDMPFCVFKVSGLGSVELLERIQSGEEVSEQDRAAFQRIKDRIDKIANYAFEHNVPMLIDAEETWIQKPIDDIAYEMMAKYNRAQAIIYNTFQLYRHDMLANLKEAFQHAAADSYFLGAKLVRGAYMEKERERADALGYPDPIQPNKEATDRDFNDALKFCIDNKQRIFLFCGSHNEYSSYYLTVLMDKHGLKPNDPRIYFGQLYGMSDHISYNLASKGYNVAKYVPYGPVKSVMPYLFRRADENTSVKGQSSRELTLLKKELKRRRQEK